LKNSQDAFFSILRREDTHMTHGKIELEDVLNFFEYEKVREEMRRRVIDLKRTRRVAVGPYLSFVFEHFVRFTFPTAAVRAFADSPAFLAVDHPAARARVELSAETKAALSEDLLG
jgi:hypothetical protein